MNLILFALPVFLLTILLELWVSHRRGQVVYDLPDALTSLQLGVLSQISGAFTKLAMLGIYAGVHQGLALTSWSLDNPWLWVLALLLYDFCFYWHHRLGHRVSVLWAAHGVHHSSEYYNLSTALRQSSSTFVLGWVFYLPMAVLGVPPQMWVVVGLLDLLYQYWVHTELIGRLGWFDRVFVSPSNHRVHHGQNDDCIDVNYGGILILWDRLFGTFREEREGEKIIYGIRQPLRSFNPLWGNLHGYASLWQQSRAAQGWWHKLDVWLAPPGGRNQPLPPLDSAHFKRFAVPTTTRLRLYVLLNYALLVLAFAHFLWVFNASSPVQAALYAGWIGASLVALGGLLGARPWGRWLEAARWAAAGLLALVVASGH